MPPTSPPPSQQPPTAVDSQAASERVRQGLIVAFRKVERRRGAATLAIRAAHCGSVTLLAAGLWLAAGMSPGSTTSVILTAIVAACGGTLVWTLWSRCSLQTQVLQLDARLGSHELLTTALYYSDRATTHAPSSVRRVLGEAEATLQRLTWATLVEPNTPSIAVAFAASALTCALVAAAPTRLGFAPLLSPPASEQAQRRTQPDGPAPGLLGAPATAPPTGETLKLTHRLVQQARHTGVSPAVRERAMELTGFVQLHLELLRADPTAPAVADYLATNPMLTDAADALRRGDWIRFQDAIRHQAQLARDPQALRQALTQAAALSAESEPEQGSIRADVVERALQHALGELRQSAASAPPSPLIAPDSAQQNPALPPAQQERPSVDGKEPALVPPPGPLPRHDLAQRAIEPVAESSPAESPHLRSGNLDRLDNAATRNSNDPSIPRRARLPLAPDAAPAPEREQSELTAALDALHTILDRTAPERTATPGAGQPGLAQGDSDPRADDAQVASSGQMAQPVARRRGNALAPDVHPNVERVRVPLRLDTPLLPDEAGRHPGVSTGLRPAELSPQTDVADPSRVLPLDHSLVPDEYRSQISRYFAPE